MLFSDAEISSGLRVVNSCAKAEAYASWLPSTDTILDDRFKFAVSVFWSSLRKRDVELARWAAENRLAFDGPLDQQAIANLHFSGAFGSQFSDVLGFSECDAIKNMLRKFEGLPQFKENGMNEEDLYGLASAAMEQDSGAGLWRHGAGHYADGQEENARRRAGVFAPVDDCSLRGDGLHDVVVDRVDGRFDGPAVVQRELREEVVELAVVRVQREADVDDVIRVDAELLADRRRLLAIDEIGDGAGGQLQSGHGRAVDAQLGRKDDGAGERSRSPPVRPAGSRP